MFLMRCIGQSHTPVWELADLQILHKGKFLVSLPFFAGLAGQYVQSASINFHPKPAAELPKTGDDWILP